MDRRKSLKAIALGTVSTGLLLDACKNADKKESGADKAAATGSNADNPTGINRMKEELARYKEETSTTFFTPEEMATIAVLSDIIIPKDDVSGSATDAKVPDFIEFIVKDMPQHQVPMRGGLRWLDLQCLKRFNHTFRESTHQQQIEMVTEIAYPLKAKPEMQQGVAFFNRMRDLTASGFFTSQIGIKDLGYVGNSPTKWEGVPADVLKDHGFNTVWG